MNPNDPAFPPNIEPRVIDGNVLLPAPGLTKREYFAAMAMSKLVMDTGPQQAASFAVAFADALINELSKESK